MAPQDLWWKWVKQGDAKVRVKSGRHGRGKRWRVSWDDPITGGTPSRAFAIKVDAERFEASVKTDINRGQYIDQQASKTPVPVYAREWCDNLQLRDTTIRKTRSAIKNHIEPVFGKLSMIEVKSSHIQGWVTSRRQLQQPLAASTIRVLYHGVVFPLFKRAAIDRAIPFNPCVDIKLPELPDGVYDLPTPLQVQSIGASLGPYYQVAPYVAAGCGLRTGEVFGLEVEHIDFLRRKLLIRQQVAMQAKGGPHLAPLKSRTSKRDVEIPEVTALSLARHLELYPPEPVLVWDRTNPDKPRQRKANLILLDPQGRPMAGGQWSALWRSAVDHAELPPDTYTMTSLRHFFATSLIYAGRNVKSVQMAMGHAKPTVTLETYLGYWPEDERDGSRGVLDAVFKVLSNPVRTGSVPDDLGSR